jgi:hypothetical protein
MVFTCLAYSACVTVIQRLQLALSHISIRYYKTPGGQRFRDEKGADCAASSGFRQHSVNQFATKSTHPGSIIVEKRGVTNFSRVSLLPTLRKYGLKALEMKPQM